MKPRPVEKDIVAIAKVYLNGKGPSIFKKNKVMFHHPGSNCVPESRLRKIHRSLFRACRKEGWAMRCDACWTTRRWNAAGKKKITRAPPALKDNSENFLDSPVITGNTLDVWMNV